DSALRTLRQVELMQLRVSNGAKLKVARDAYMHGPVHWAIKSDHPEELYQSFVSAPPQLALPAGAEESQPAASAGDNG
ncbi:unnamed protein product, partial [Phaeothamnion confervicola]